MKAVPKLGASDPARGEGAQELVAMLDVGRDVEVGCLEVVRHGHAPRAAGNPDMSRLPLLFLGRLRGVIGGRSGRPGAGDDNQVLPLHPGVIVGVALLGDGLAHLAVDDHAASGNGLAHLLLLTTALLAPRHAVPVTVAKVSLGDGDLAVDAVTELDAGLAACGVAAHELVAVLDAIGDDEVGGLEVVIDRHATGPARHDGCATGGRRPQLVAEGAAHGGVTQHAQAHGPEAALEALADGVEGWRGLGRSGQLCSVEGSVEAGVSQET
mmetsp:Transcript_58210/g.123456  ORF Transcript_58210/g.123456 Transcript_58210/m.123456 type:complete len:268 (-) Transcript_58210:393-1196(-)